MNEKPGGIVRPPIIHTYHRRGKRGNEEGGIEVVRMGPAFC